MIFKKLQLVAFLFLGLWLSAAMCTKVITYADDHHTDAVTHGYSTNLETALRQTQKALEGLGYEVLSVDESRNQITTGWRSTTSDSHYLNLFGRRDYGAGSGSYYQLVADVFQDAHLVNVSVHGVVKSLSGRLTSAQVVENKVLTRLDDLLRSPQIEITNVGVKER